MASSTMARPMSEAALQRTITDACDLLGLPWFHIRRSERNPGEGYPDLTIADWRHGVVRFWELKTMKGQLHGKQPEWLESLGACNRVDVQLVRPDRLDWALGELGR